MCQVLRFLLYWLCASSVIKELYTARPVVAQ